MRLGGGGAFIPSVLGPSRTSAEGPFLARVLSVCLFLRFCITLGVLPCMTERVVLFHLMDVSRYSACCEVLLESSLISFISSAGQVGVVNRFTTSSGRFETICSFERDPNRQDEAG